MKKIIKKFAILLSLLSLGQVHAENKALLAREDVKAFIQEMSHKHHFEVNQLMGWLGQANLQPTIITTMTKPAEKLPWHRYRTIFLTPQRVNEGILFWQQHAKTLAQAEKEFGVPAEIIIAIIGVETFYGKRPGTINVLDALVTLAFDYPPRAKFFLSELEEFLVLTKEEQWDPTQIKGSYAGAMGNPQFIASSYRRYAVDFNQNGKRDLINNMDDAIGSVGNYFKVHGWAKGAPIVLPASTKGDQFQSLIASKMNPKPQYSLKEMSEKGVNLKASHQKNAKQIAQMPLALIALENEKGFEYWLGAHNFYVITRYNHSDHYAMAVYELSQELKKGYHKKA